MIAVGSTNASKVYLGSEEISKIYLGSTQIWGGSSPTPVPPYDAEIEWLKSDSNGQYIDTGIECTGDLKVRFIGMVHDNTFATHAAGGILVVNGSVTFRHHWTPFYSSRDKAFYNISSGGLTGATFVTQGLVDGWVDVVVEPTTGNMSVNGSSSKTFTAVSSSLTTGHNYGIFARIDNSGNVVAEPSSFKLFQMWKAGVLVRDYIPVRVGQVGYLYDKVSEELFGNDGSGSFIIGNDVSNTYDAQIEYVGSNNSTNYWINTGVIRPESFTSVEFEVTAQFLSTSGRQIMGAKGSVYFGISQGQWEYGYNRYSGTADTNVHTFKRILTVLNGNAYYEQYIDGTKIGDYTVTWIDAGFVGVIGLFNIEGLSPITSYANIFGSKIKLNGTLVRDYIPVRVGQVGYLFDKITSRLFGNDLSGSLTLGNDVTN